MNRRRNPGRNENEVPIRRNNNEDVTEERDKLIRKFWFMYALFAFLFFGMVSLYVMYYHILRYDSGIKDFMNAPAYKQFYLILTNVILLPGCLVYAYRQREKTRVELRNFDVYY